MAAQIVKDGRKGLAITYGEGLSVATVIGLAVFLLTRTFSAGAQSNEYKRLLESKAGSAIVDSIASVVALKADKQQIDQMAADIAVLKGDMQAVRCAVAPSDLRCKGR